RHTEVIEDEVADHPDLEVLASSSVAGVFLMKSRDDKHIMVTGHLEYDATTLKDEYDRDVAKGVDIQLPKKYFETQDHAKITPKTCRHYTHLLFLNWLNYYVYQETHFQWE